MKYIIYFGLCLLFSLIFEKIMKKINFPYVTGYLIAGIIIGPYALNIISLDFINDIELLNDIALSFIALSIGAEFKLSFLKKIGKAPIIIAIFEALITTIVIDIILIIFKVEIPLALSLGAIGSATASAATIMIIKQYNAKGSLSELILSVVALDDAVALIIFGISITIIEVITQNKNVSLLISFLNPIKEIILALLLGSFLAVFLIILNKFFKEKTSKTILIIIFVLFSLGISRTINVPDLISTMVMAAIFINFSNDANKTLNVIDQMTPPLLIMFFFLSGAYLDLSKILGVGVIGIIYLIFRVLGKVSGAIVGGIVAKKDFQTTKNLGFSLIPQAGIALGLATTMGNLLPNYADSIKTVILSSTIIFELIGPLVTKYILIKTKNIDIIK